MWQLELLLESAPCNAMCSCVQAHPSTHASQFMCPPAEDHGAPNPRPPCRVYRGATPAGSDPGMFLVADGGTAFADDLHAYELGSIWERSEDRPVKVQEPAEG